MKSEKEKELEHRLAMVSDDLQCIRRFIFENGLAKTFAKPTDECDECWTHLVNIEIACCLSSDESLSWKPFNKSKQPNQSR
jgi:hypothetical protein